MSERTFARRFADDVGTSPHRWLTAQRVLRARHLLETTDLDVEQVSHSVGFGNAAGLRHHFQREVGLSPVAYRRQFATGTVESGS
jgi:transcriptional regulator GlxA family with amidase domain